MEHKCPICGTEMNIYNQIKSDMIDNPYIGKIMFECPNCRCYKKIAFDIKRIYAALDVIDTGTPVLDCNNFDDFLKKLEELAWNKYVGMYREFLRMIDEGVKND